MAKEVENGKQIEKQYTQLNGINYSYPVVDIGNELYLKFDVNDGESIYYEMVIEHEGIILATGVSLVVWHECKSHLAIEQTEFLNWGYKDGKIGEFIHDDWSCLTSFPIDATLTDDRPMRFIEDETLNCRHCGAEKVVYGRKSDEHVRKLYGIAVGRDEPRYGCPYWHF